ncbi:RsmD family RNA methyltransferase [Coprobacter tertius]|uniref:RsmD family RNA methyltransferase n=1 Tax=Coprobacter tertius TaxID=2944915 RepID=A0ABT1ME07_9BACT|nr:RsmD family RNA methyltransferase [Coprobacter tertius]MCP9610862.1 RsmD family RNA methyltransferase [Coprobacter tertius]
MRIISGKYGKRRFDVPTNIKARPTTDFARENLFNVLGNLIDFEGKTALDLFAGTGAVSFELCSRGCSRVVCVEHYGVQYNFIRKVQQLLGDKSLLPVKGDVFKFISSCRDKFDFIFADPPYDLPQLEKIPEMILKSELLKPDGLLVVEHSRKNDFSSLPEFIQHREYGSVNFSFFRVKEEAR